LKEMISKGRCELLHFKISKVFGLLLNFLFCLCGNLRDYGLDGIPCDIVNFIALFRYILHEPSEVCVESFL